ncbi:MAG TPA: glycosyl hydrolase, partial [Clostridia bacterium]|nr:glycosyl hydrolase [Clostridia bacterium]
MDDIEKQFANPPVSFKGAPFWSWNGKLDKKELLRQIDVLQKMGMGGYFCHSRTGLITEYLGEEWFDLINACADYGKEKGMQTWLYDEDRWPSGTAGGMVTKNPSYRLHYLRLTILPPGSTFDFSTDIVAAFTADVDDLAFTNKKRIYHPEEASGKTVLLFSDEEMASDSFYNGYTYVDTMNKEATEEYIRITHEKYTEKCGSRLSDSIVGIFTDEPHRGSVMCGYSLNNPTPHFLTPYPKELFEHFRKAYGYDLIEFLPELFLQANGEKVHPVKWQYMELLQALFIDNFFKPINEWCKRNNMMLTGHVLHEDTLTAQTAMIGSVMRAYEYFDAPGVDVLGEHNYKYWIVKQLQSAARQLGKSTLLSELYGCTGWHMSFDNHKAVGDWQALFGINLRCHHLCWYTMLGEAKRDYPASIFYQSAWFSEYKTLEDYYSRIHVLMSRGEPVCKVLVVNPVESLWAIIYPGWANILSTADSTAAKLEETYSLVFSALNSARIDFDYGDEDYLKRLASVQTQNGKTVLRVGK